MVGPMAPPRGGSIIKKRTKGNNSDSNSPRKSPRTHKTETKRLAHRERDYEGEFAEAAEHAGLVVIDRTVWKKNHMKLNYEVPAGGVTVDSARIVVRQYMPHVPSLRGAEPRKWACDFACPALKVSVEIDGFGGKCGVERKTGYGGLGAHRTWAGFHRDREKDRDMTLAGWRILRFGPGDLSTPANVARCVREFAELIGHVAEDMSRATQLFRYDLVPTYSVRDEDHEQET